MPILGDILFWSAASLRCIKNEWNNKKIILAGDKFMPQIHLKQPGLTYSACWPFTKNKERIQKQEIQNVFTKMNLIKLVFNMTWLMEIVNI